MNAAYLLDCTIATGRGPDVITFRTNIHDPLGTGTNAILTINVECGVGKAYVLTFFPGIPITMINIEEPKHVRPKRQRSK